MSRKVLRILLLCAALLPTGCAVWPRHGLDPSRAAQVERAAFPPYNLSRETEDRILALNPMHVTEKDVREVLAPAPAPRIINIHGGIYPVHLRMVSFSRFLMGMGYPGASITNPGDGTYSFSCYESSAKIAGVIAWYYERDGMRPMLIGHSQGGFQVVKVLDKLAGKSFSRKLAVWNPLTWQREHRYTITDPLTGKTRPVVGLGISYAVSMGAGGLTRILPNQWDMNFRLRTIPNSVDEFTGFYKHRDLLGGDFLGWGPANLFKANGTAHVRNVRLPGSWKHGAVPDTVHLLKSQEIIDRINHYQPGDDALVVVPSNEDTMKPETLHLFFAEDVWFSVKKHWVLELQRLIRAKRALHDGH